ncbi:hypothetical protein GGR16_002404 [Chelatococcus caeni]|uniref:DUF2184 domain-containing protein n=1 Tax=Chelatococcus caeni TaxID=1348468 RepID=A0A840BVJ3_9HYPH|nr:DUF2184 domain-containing protein [Chelatococcus caeni]MBB4017375.1 hypothetical protein [Chelatococcus caeni]
MRNWNVLALAVLTIAALFSATGAYADAGAAQAVAAGLGALSPVGIAAGAMLGRKVVPGMFALAKPAIIRARTRDGMLTFDQRTIDSTGAFLIGELERLDQNLYEPLVDVTWGRDIDLREDVSIADEVSSFTNSSFAAAGGVNPNGKAWIGSDSNSISAMQLDIGKTAQPLTLWGQEISYTIPELESAMKLGRPVDAQKYEGMQLKHQMDTDEMVYVGDEVLGYNGLVNANIGGKVTNVSNVANGAGGTPGWTTKTPDEILGDVNELLTSVWQASAWAVTPNRLLLPPAQYGYIATVKVSEAGNVSILKYILENNISRQKGVNLEIYPLKWLIGRGVGGTPGQLGTVDRMVAYTKDIRRVRFPMTPLQRTPLEYRSIWQMTTYFGRLGVVEFVYPETIGYRDGL